MGQGRGSEKAEVEWQLLCQALVDLFEVLEVLRLLLLELLLFAQLLVMPLHLLELLTFLLSLLLLLHFHSLCGGS